MRSYRIDERRLAGADQAGHEDYGGAGRHAAIESSPEEPPVYRGAIWSRTTSDTALAAVAAYDRVAAEYDAQAHERAGALSALGAQALSVAEIELAARAQVAEIGSGTGQLTTALIEQFPAAQLLATDPSARMLERLRQKLPGVPTALGRLDELGERIRTADLVACGLADPYLDRAAVEFLIRNSCGCLFVSVPTREWALAERTGRLGIPIDRTRFRLADGSTVEAPSYVYNEDELRQQLADAGFDVRRAGTVSAADPSPQPRPSVSWAVAVSHDSSKSSS